MSNYSGTEHVVINTRERAVSNDINNIQKTIARSRANLLGRQFGTSYPQVTPNGSTVHGFDLNPTLAATPLQADVYGGLLVRVFSSFLLVTPGTLGCWTNVGGLDAEDSRYSIIDDPGLTSVTSLLFTTNAGPGVRVDVVEASVTAVTLTQESRDIFDNTTGLFTAALVPKRVASRLTYRLRTGSAGSGYPGHAAGWLPLAVIAVPTGATSFGGCCFWDVRPLVQDRINGQKASYADTSQIALNGSNMVNSTTGIITGFYSINGDGHSAGDTGCYRAFGMLRDSYPGAPDTYGMDVTNPSNWGQGVDFSGSNEGWGYIMALFPEGLPRWVRYSTNVNADGERLPLDTMGILTVCRGPVSACGSTAGPAVIPSDTTGLTNTSGGVLTAIFRRSTEGPLPHRIIPAYRTAKGIYRRKSPGGSAHLSIPHTLSGSLLTATFNLGTIGGTYIPYTTSRIKCLLWFTHHNVNPWQYLTPSINLFVGAEQLDTVFVVGQSVKGDGATLQRNDFIFDIYLPNTAIAAGYPGTSGAVTLVVTPDGATTTISDTQLELVEFDYGVA